LVNFTCFVEYNTSCGCIGSNHSLHFRTIFQDSESGFPFDPLQLIHVSPGLMKTAVNSRMKAAFEKKLFI
jgi:hypothetical protein